MITENPNAILARIQSAPKVAGVDNSKFALSTEAPEPTERVGQEAAEKAFDQATSLMSENRETTKQFVQQLKSNNAKTATITDIVSGAIKDAGEAEGIIAAVKDNANLKAQNNTIKTYEAGGGEEMQAKLTARLAEDHQRLEDIINERTEIANTEYTGIELIDQIINRFNINLTKDKYEAAQAEKNQTINQIAEFTGATDAFARQNATVAKTMNQATINANAEKIAAQAVKDAKLAELNAMTTNARGLETVINATNKQADNYMSAYRMQGERENRELQREKMVVTRERIAQEKEDLPRQRELAELNYKTAQLNYDRSVSLTPLQVQSAEVALEAAKFRLANDKDLSPLQRQNLELTVKDKQASLPVNRARTELALQTALKEKQDIEAIEANFSDSVRAAQAMMGIPIQEDNAVIMRALNSNTPLGEIYNELLVIGEAGTGQLGATPFDAASIMDRAAPNGVAQEDDGIRLLARVARDLDAVYKQTGQAAPRDEETQRADFNRVADKVQDDFAREIVTGDSSNPYHAPNMDVLKGFRAVRESKLYKEILAPAGNKDFNPDVLMQLATAGIKAKKVTPEEATEGLVALARAAVSHNNEVDKYSAYGLKPQSSYNINIIEGVSLLGTAFNVFTPGKLLKGLSKANDAANNPDDKSYDMNSGGIVDTELRNIDMLNSVQVKSVLIKRMSMEGNN